MLYLPAIVDVEASALDGGFPIEIGFAFKTVSNAVHHESMLIRHDPWLKNGRWSAEAEAIHGISKEEIYDNGRPALEVCTWLNDRIGPQKLYVGDMRDKMWLSHAFEIAERAHIFQLEYLDKWMELAHVSQQLYFQFLGIAPHRAGPDAGNKVEAIDRCLELAA